MRHIEMQYEALAQASEYLVDDHVGIIRFIEEVPREAGDPSFFHYYAQACDAKAFWKQSNFSRTGGASSTRELAMAKAIGEAVERYCSACYDEEDLPLASFNTAPFRCIRPARFALYNDHQYGQDDFPYKPFTDDTLVRWVPATDLKTGELLCVPAAMVYLPYYYHPKEDEHPIIQPISTGLACHTSFTDATISAICEVIERDAFTIAWQAKLSPCKIRRDSLTDENCDLVLRFERTGNHVELYDLTTDIGISTILAICKGTHSNTPALVVAASTDLDPHRAIRKSLEELAHTWQLARHLKRHMPTITPSPEFPNVIHQDDHIVLYCDYASSRFAEFISASERQIDCDDLPNLSSADSNTDLDILIDRIHAIHHRVLITDLTTPDIYDLGMSVVRAMIPGFHPLFMGHKFRALGGMRLWTVPQLLGYPARSLASGDNPAPHPYP